MTNQQNIDENLKDVVQMPNPTSNIRTVPRSMKIIQFVLQFLNIVISLMAVVSIVVLLSRNNWSGALFVLVCVSIFLMGYIKYAKERGKKIFIGMGFFQGRRYIGTLLVAGGAVLYVFIQLLLGKL